MVGGGTAAAFRDAGSMICSILLAAFDTAVWMHHLDANKTAREEARRQLHKNAATNIE